MSNTEQNEEAGAIVQEQVNVTQFEIAEDGSICLYEQLEDLKKISKTLYEGGVVPTELRMNEANLETFYMNMIEGNER